MHKSSLNKLKEIDFEKEIIITEINADKKVVEDHFQRLKTILKDKESDEEIWKRINSIVIRDNIFNATMQRIVEAYEFDIDEKDIAEMAGRMKSYFGDREPKIINEISEKMIVKELVFEELAKLWNISVTDEEVKNALESYAKFSNQSIDDKLKNKAELDNIKKMIFEEKIANEIVKKIRYKIDLKDQPKIK